MAPGGRYARPEEVYRLALLRALYEGLLSPRQRQVIAMKVDEDMSFAEMSQRLGISRQACEDALRRGERRLHMAEKRLGFGERVNEAESLLKAVSEAVFAMTESNWERQKALVLQILESSEGW